MPKLYKSAAWDSNWRQAICLVAVAALILGTAAYLFVSFQCEASSLWYSTAHDRNGHYLRCQNMARALRQGSIVSFVKEINAATVWPPFHPFVTGALLAATRLDYRIAVLSSLAAWVVCCGGAFALAHQLAPQNKKLAAFVALLFTLASPAHRSYATDIMLESMGAGLTMSALYFYVAARQQASARHGRCFALLMLALFLTKYNYWLLLALGLAVDALWEFHSAIQQSLARRLATFPPFVGGQLRHPLTYLIAAACVMCGYVLVAGRIAFAGVTIDSLSTPALTCFVLVLLRLVPWWWQIGRDAIARLPVPAKQLVYWHLYPVVLWFLWPRRLGIFLWYITFTEHGRVSERWPIVGNVAYYWGCLAGDYHAGTLSLVLVIALGGVAVAARRRWTMGTSAVFVFLALAALLTNYHSANRSRFLHSWLAAGWVVAGVGAASGVELLGRLRWPRWRGVLMMEASDTTAIGGMAYKRRAAAVALAIGVILAQGVVLLHAGHAEEGGPRTGHPAFLNLADAVAPQLMTSRRPVLISDAPFQLMLSWRLSEQRWSWQALQAEPRNSQTRWLDQFPEWLRRSGSDLVLLVDASKTPDAGLGTRIDLAQVRSLLIQSGTFSRAWMWRASPPDQLFAEVWRALPSVTAEVRHRPAEMGYGGHRFQALGRQANESQAEKRKSPAATREALSNGGGENRTRVPKCFGTGIYVCSPPFSRGRDLAASPAAFVRPSPDRQGPVRTIRP